MAVVGHLLSTQSNIDFSFLNLWHPSLKHTFEVSKRKITRSDVGQTLQQGAEGGYGDSTHLTPQWYDSEELQVSPHLAQFWAEGWAWWPPRVPVCFSSSSNESHLHQAPLASVKKVELGSGTLHPLLVVPGVTLGLGKVSTDSTSAGRAHVEGSAAESFKYACCCS